MKSEAQNKRFILPRLLQEPQFVPSAKRPLGEGKAEPSNWRCRRFVAVSVDGDYCFPGYDNNGNVIGYWDEDGDIVAEYSYDAFGNTIDEDGDMADFFPHRFSTKYYDSETDLYYYGYRYYSRWVT